MSVELKARCCGTCHFWKLTDADEETGECRKEPPKYLGGDMFGGFPKTRGRTWCGSHIFDPHVMSYEQDHDWLDQ